MNPALPPATVPASAPRPSRAPHPPWTGLPRGLALLITLMGCKLVVLLLRASDGSSISSGPLTWLALWAEDLLCAGLFVLLDLLLQGLLRGRQRVVSYLLYAALCLYLACNVPVMRMFGTPLTFPILQAADTALTDSLAIYVTRSNVLGCLSVLLLAIASPLLLRSIRGIATPRPLILWLLVGLWLTWVLCGLGVRAQVPLRGLSRSPLLLLIHTTLQQRSAHGVAASIELPPLPPLAQPSAPAGESGLGGLIGAAQGRDVLWIVLESTAARSLRPYGAPADPMPNLTALAARSVQFESVYAAYPESIKGLFATLCSMNPAAHTTAARYTHRKLPCPSIGSRFQQAGYRTAMFHSGWFLYLGMDGIVAERGFSVAEDAGAIGGAYTTSFGVDEASTVQRVLRYFDSLSPTDRAFVMYLPIAGHHPYHSPGPAQRPKPFAENTELGAYQNDLHLGDAAIGTLLDGLRQRGRLSRLLVVVSADHGEAFLQHEGNFGHTLHLYEENVRVPLWLHLPGWTDQPEKAQRRPQPSAPASLLDVAPTLLDLTGLPIPSAYQGQSLLRPRSPDAVPRFLIDHAVEQVGLRHGPWKFIDEPDTDRAQLFDLVHDPDEQHDLSRQHPQQVATYRAHLRAFFSRQRLLITAR